MLCPQCNLRGHADRNASVVIGQRLLTRYQEQQTQEKPLAPLATERESKDAGGGGSHEPETEAVGHSSHTVWHGTSNGHGTARERAETDGSARSDMLPPLRCSPSWGYAPSTPNTAYGSVSEVAGL